MRRGEVVGVFWKLTQPNVFSTLWRNWWSEGV